jgi:hypothetical protein
MYSWVVGRRRTEIRWQAGGIVAVLIDWSSFSYATEPPKGAAYTPPAAAAATGSSGRWTTAEIVAAKSECLALLDGVEAEISYLPPISEGSCGLPQPIELRAFGKPRVKVDPPAILNCAMVASLSRWFVESVQPEASAQFKSPIVSVQNVGAYSCRAYPDPKRRNEHAKGNAIDISGFTTSDGMTITVAKSWGPSLRHLLTAPPGPGSDTLAPSDPGLRESNSGKGADAIRAARIAEAARRGIAMPKPSTTEGIFIHAIHDAACKIFGTVLSPEANDDHNEHFHLDMAQRPGDSYCE